jgi:hypothetical protein
MRIESLQICHQLFGYSFLGSSRKGRLDGTPRLRLLNRSGVGLGADNPRPTPAPENPLSLGGETGPKGWRDNSR